MNSDKTKLPEISLVSDLPEEVLNKIGLSSITMGASADTKVSIAQYETAGVFASFSMTFDLSQLTGSMPVHDIVKEVVIPIRNSFAKFSHPETMARVEELRAIIEGIRDGKNYNQISSDVQKARAEFLSIMAKSFEKR